MSKDPYSPEVWDTEPAATWRPKQKLFIENAKHQTASQSGGITAFIAFFLSHGWFHSWLMALLAAAVTYWVVIVTYKKKLQRAQADSRVCC